MDPRFCALVVLSGCGRCRGDARDPVAAAQAIVGADCLHDAADALAGPWLASGGRILSRDHPDWPDGLNDLGDDAPLLLWVRGRVPEALRTAVAVVGSRACTGYGRSMAGGLAGEVARHDAWVVSGGAVGIDEAAHTAAMTSGGSTLLCAAGGAGQVYPADHETLFRQVAASGGVAWEYPPGTRLTRRGFLHRNRLISAVAGTTVLVEAARRSGALNTGRRSADLGRLVLGVPGPVTSAVSAGVHAGIAEGWATIVMDSADLLDLTGLRVGPV